MAKHVRANRKDRLDREERRKQKSNNLKEHQKACIEEQVKLANDQIEALQCIKENKITLLNGKAGSGKTFISCYYAIQSLLKREVEGLYITRPAVGTEDLGFIPGGIQEKYDPWLKPIYQNFSNIFGLSQLQGLIRSNRIEMLPLQFTRGVTYENCVTIIDEAQNITIPQIKLCMSRLGVGSKIIFCGDTDQIDLKKYKDSGLKFLIDYNFDDIEGIGVYELITEHREPIIVDILDKFKELNY